MSKKFVSDIMKPVVIFPNDQSAYITSRFEVRNHPVVLRAFGIDCDTIGHIEMGYSDGCGGWFWGPYIPDCDQLALLGCANAIAIGLPGWYRIVFRDRVTKQPLTGLDDLIVTITETDMPASMLAQFTGGNASMGCGNQVSVRKDVEGCFFITVDNQAHRICPGDNVSCDPDGLGIVINGTLCPFPVMTPQTQVSNGAGSLEDENTYTVDHKGTWPNETIRTMWGARSGDSVMLNFWNPAAGDWDAVAVESPENIVILNNPVIRIDSFVGAANPPIKTQADLATMPFNSFDAVRSFMTRTLTVGTVTLDTFGIFPNGAGNVGPAQFKNAQNIVVRSVQGDHNATINFGGNGVGGNAPAVGVTVTGGNVTLQGLQFLAHPGTPANLAAAVVIGSTAAVTLDRIRASGTYNASVGPAGFLFYNNNGGSLTIAPNTTLDFAMAAGTILTNMFYNSSGARFTIGGSVTFNYRVSRINLQDRAMIFLSSGAICNLRHSNPGSPNPLAVTGTQFPIAGSSVRVNPLTSISGSVYGNRAALINYDFGPEVTAGGAKATMSVDAIGTVNDVAGP